MTVVVSNLNKKKGDRVQWNLDLTKSLGTDQICSLNGGFVISRFLSIHFSVTLAGT